MESLLNRTFPSFQAAQAACDTVARTNGYALSVAAKKPNAAEPSYVYLRCSKGRKYVDRGNEAIANRRKSSTQMTACPFRLILKLDRLQISWAVSCPRDSHNHPFIEEMAHAKYKGEVISTHLHEIIQLYNNGLRPVSITAHLRARSQEDPALAGVTAKQINNALARHRRDQLA
ncbi:hypothetical protein HRG_008297 [Hirsutella rhossiliensis]|uniref:FAR1 domain-containing protein n=1 Tax=Hirsutella rhossiliensis TaxID=111463 RepID=A0A9P8SGI0_9HYPO|nr:uncharacterized protein HRG_08297 [Hirsutella rhossiliensis]KAH0961144.1 hypothetical protein HRG_08297 [Hirsutella rhossiliensis]